MISSIYILARKREKRKEKKKKKKSAHTFHSTFDSNYSNEERTQRILHVSWKFTEAFENVLSTGEMQLMKE